MSTRKPHLHWEQIGHEMGGDARVDGMHYRATVQHEGTPLLTIYAGGTTSDEAIEAMVLAEKRTGEVLHAAWRQVDPPPPGLLFSAFVALIPFAVGVITMAVALADLAAELFR